MRVAHFDCFSGISGDMTLGALLDAGVPPEPVLSAVASLGLPIQVAIEKVRKGGFAATQVTVKAPAEPSHRFLPEVEEILARGNLTARQRDLAVLAATLVAKTKNLSNLAHGQSPHGPRPSPPRASAARPTVIG